MPTTDSEPALVRAADLIGQLGDPNHSRKLNALYCEFVETGIAAQLGYRSPADLAEQYPKFFWSKVEPYLDTALAHLERTVSRQAVDRPALRPRVRRGAQAAPARAGAGPGRLTERQAARVRLALISAGARRVCRTTQ